MDGAGAMRGNPSSAISSKSRKSGIYGQNSALMRSFKINTGAMPKTPASIIKQETRVTSGELSPMDDIKNSSQKHLDNKIFTQPEITYEITKEDENISNNDITTVNISIPDDQ